MIQYMNDPEICEVAVVVPVYNSEDCLDDLLARLTGVLEKAVHNYEIILVNDASKDRSWDKIKKLAKVYKKLKAINFKKNFGQDNAIMAGLIHSKGETIIIMDDDLQHDPNDIPLLLDQIKKGYDVCYANFDSKKQSWIKNAGSWFNGKVANIVIEKPDNIYLSPFKAIARKAVNEIIKYDGPYPYIDGLLFGATNNITQINAQHHARYAGKSNYNLLRSIGVWARLATSFSVLPLRIATFTGFAISISAFALALLFILQYLSGEPAPSGWASMMVVVLFLGGVQLLMLGIMGEYIGRLALHSNKKPQFVIDKIIHGNN